MPTGTSINMASLLLMLPAKEPMFNLGTPQNVLFEILTTGIIRMVQTVIIDYSLSGRYGASYNNRDATTSVKAN